MNPLQVARQNWAVGDSREAEARKIDMQIGVEYDSYRRVYRVEGREWIITGQIAKEDGKKYYILECVG